MGDMRDPLDVPHRMVEFRGRPVAREIYGRVALADGSLIYEGSEEVRGGGARPATSIARRRGVVVSDL